ncbi:hypothetical protein K491DRAFT_688953 [Lophiostoma macrostomum CBS 122681]|uniref:NAD(P)-binding protein n=1 Tax=Lophiostoma macrostomum CBS 122681 TaxID=1314788 RepID=A0A6A6TIK5_9PLEO|nr:hypothetical protein K491DRAFT_688953 [Lophiostoma macrostomum CBS 122681]
MLRTSPTSVDFLILGAGWTSTFLIPQLDSAKITHAETTTSGHHGTIPFVFDPKSEDEEPYKRLPDAKTVLITFPLKGKGPSRKITELYRKTHDDENSWIQLGSTGIFNVEEEWSTDDSAYDASDERAIAEDELIECVGGCVLNLCGLWGGERQPKRWIERLAKSKDDVRKRNVVHFVHGEDVARAIIAVHRHGNGAKGKGKGKRWIVADLRVYDWWDLILSFAALAEGVEEESEKERERKLQFAKWVGELMVEEGVRALPREASTLGRRLDSRGFWREMGTWPRHSRLA